MLRITMPRIGFADAWRSMARDLLQRGVAPADVDWGSEGEAKGLFDVEAGEPDALHPVARPSVPKAFLPLSEAAVCHSGPERFALTYRVLWRLQADRDLLLDRSDRDVAALYGMENR